MKLILFDIDGTLIWPDGAGRAAMNHALTEVFGILVPADSLPMAGKTDWQIVVELLTTAGLVWSDLETKLPECFQAITRHMTRTSQERTIRVCPGIPELLARLFEHPGAILGLLTGNLATTAPIKLRAAGLDPAIFCVGAYGNDAPSRSQLPAIAIERAAALTGHAFREKNVVIVGDTPEDIVCGQHLGVRAIGVATGQYALEVLTAAGADHAFSDLTDTDLVIQAML